MIPSELFQWPVNKKRVFVEVCTANNHKQAFRENAIHTEKHPIQPAPHYPPKRAESHLK